MASAPASQAVPPDVALAADFPLPDRADWLAMVERTLKGAPLASLIRRTIEGLAIEPLYDAAAPAAAPARPARGWNIRTLVRAADPARANAEILEDLAGGASSVLIRLDPAAADGVAVESAEGLARVLDGVLLDAAPVALEAGFLAPKAADWLAIAAKGAPAASMAFHMDPLSAFAEAGASPGPIEAHLIACAGVGARLAAPYPAASLFLASGRAAHEAGAGEAAEIAMAAAAALAYAKALAKADMGPERALGRIVLGLAVDADPFLGMAKLRAARLVWAKLAAACGAGAPAAIEARSSRRMITVADAWTNMIRLTAAGFAAAVGGADAIVLGAFTDAVGAPRAFARRQARNAQLVLMEEANLGRVIDPAAGSGYVEALTEAIARSAWERLQAIERAGGIVRALEGGLVASWAEEGRTELKRRITARELKLLGVTDFQPTDAQPPGVASREAQTAPSSSPRLPGPDSRCPPLAQVRLEDLV
jgi:methylmalonyl-CoA mutase